MIFEKLRWAMHGIQHVSLRIGGVVLIVALDRFRAWLQGNAAESITKESVMSDLEKAAIKIFAKELVDELLPAIIKAEEERLPVAYQALAAAVTSALLPQLQAAIDAKIAAI